MDVDDGGGGGGGGGGFFGIAVRGNLTLGNRDTVGTPDPADDIVRPAVFRSVGGRGGSTYQTVTGSPPAPASATAPRGEGSAGGGGGGGGVSIIAGGSITATACQIFCYGKLGGSAPSIEAGGRAAADQGGNGGGGKAYVADSNGFGPAELSAFVINPTGVAADATEMSGLMTLSLDVYGNGPREAMFGPTQIVTEFFDTLSDSTSYDGALILWNAPRFSYAAGDGSMRVMRIFIDTVKGGAGGLPDVTTVEAPDGSFTLDPSKGFTQEVPAVDPLGPAAAYQMQEVLPAGAASQGKRFVRVRIKFDPTLISASGDVLLGPAPLGFAPAGAPLLPIADDPATPGLENTRGNLDTAPQGVPAIAELRVTFTP